MGSWEGAGARGLANLTRTRPRTPPRPPACRVVSLPFRQGSAEAEVLLAPAWRRTRAPASSSPPPRAARAGGSADAPSRRWWSPSCTATAGAVEPASTATGFQARCRCATSPVSGVTPPWQGARGGGPPGGRAGRQGGPGHGPGGAAVQPHPGGGARRGGGVLALARAVRLAHEAGWVPGAPRPGPARDCTPPGAPPARRPGASRASGSPAGLPPPPVRARSPPPPSAAARTAPPPTSTSGGGPCDRPDPKPAAARRAGAAPQGSSSRPGGAGGSS